MSDRTVVDTNILIYAHDRDAPIVAAARKAGAGVLLSEDPNAGQEIDGVRVENPLPH